MRRILVSIFAQWRRAAVVMAALFCLTLDGCMVHEWPDEGIPASVEVELVFDTEFLPLRDVEYTRKTKNSPSDFNIRYQIRAYRALKNGGYDDKPQAEFIFTKEDVSSPDHMVTIDLPDGSYMLRVWADYVDDGEIRDKYYDTGDFSSIKVVEPYEGDTDFRDAFEGSSEVSVKRLGADAEKTRVRVNMDRPLAKFQIVATDFYDLVTKAMEDYLSSKEYEEFLQTRHRGTPPQSSDSECRFDVSSSDRLPEDSSKAAWDPTKAPGFDPEDYRIVIYYTSYLPTEYNMLTGKPIDAKTGMEFISCMQPLNEEEALIGFDYVIVNGIESSVNIQAALFAPDGDMISLSNAVTVPVMRGKVTTVRGKFLTLTTGGGIGIDPGFDGDFNLIF